MHGEGQKAEKSRDVIPQLSSNFGLRAERLKFSEPHRGNMLYPRQCSLFLREIPGTETQFAEKWTPPHHFTYPATFAKGTKKSAFRSESTSRPAVFERGSANGNLPSDFGPKNRPSRFFPKGHAFSPCRLLTNLRQKSDESLEDAQGRLMFRRRILCTFFCYQGACSSLPVPDRVPQPTPILRRKFASRIPPQTS